MNKMIAVTIRPGATTAAARLICPFACSSPPPAAASTSAKVPSNSENSRRHSRRGSSKSARSPNSSHSTWCVRGNAGPSAAGSTCRAARPGARPLRGPALARTVRPAHRHVVCHAPGPSRQQHRKASQSRRQARASSSPARRGPPPAPSHCRDVSPQAQSHPRFFLICIVVPGAPGRPGTKVPVAEQVRSGGPRTRACR